MVRSRKLSRSALDVLAVFHTDPMGEYYGREIAKAAHVLPGSLYPILQRFETDDVLAARWEDVDASVEGRPRRRYYTLTAKGRALASAQAGAIRSQWAPQHASRIVATHLGWAP